MAKAENRDGLATISEIKTGAYIWFVGALCLSGFLVYTLASYDRKLYDTKNKYIDGDMHRENRLSAASLPQTDFDKRTDGEFTSAVEKLGK